MKKKLMLCLSLVLIIVLSLVVIRLILPHFVFFPSTHIRATPIEINLTFEDIRLTTSDNVRIQGWYIPAENARATLLFFHGNSGNISHRLDSFRLFNDLGLSVFIPSYRGYAQSEGRPSIKGVNLDALAAWQWLTEDKLIPAGNIIVLGQSLGGAIAMELTRRVTPGALIVESTFSSLAAMTPFPAPIAPILLGGDFWNSAKTARDLNIPTLCIHSQEDDVIPYSQGRRIYEAVGLNRNFNEKTFLEIQGDHNSGFLQSLEIYAAGLDGFITKYFGEAAP